MSPRCEAQQPSPRRGTNYKDLPYSAWELWSQRKFLWTQITLLDNCGFTRCHFPTNTRIRRISLERRTRLFLVSARSFIELALLVFSKQFLIFNTFVQISPQSTFLRFGHELHYYNRKFTGQTTTLPIRWTFQVPMERILKLIDKRMWSSGLTH